MVGRKTRKATKATGKRKPKRKAAKAATRKKPATRKKTAKKKVAKRKVARKKATKKKTTRKSEKFKEIPGLVKNKNIRTSLAIKFILINAKKKEGSLNFPKKFNKEILSNAENQESSIQVKNNLQKDVLKKKRYFLYYKWN